MLAPLKFAISLTVNLCGCTSARVFYHLSVSLCHLSVTLCHLATVTLSITCLSLSVTCLSLSLSPVCHSLSPACHSLYHLSVSRRWQFRSTWMLRLPRGERRWREIEGEGKTAGEMKKATRRRCVDAVIPSVDLKSETIRYVAMVKWRR